MHGALADTAHYGRPGLAVGTHREGEGGLCTACVAVLVVVSCVVGAPLSTVPRCRVIRIGCLQAQWFSRKSIDPTRCNPSAHASFKYRETPSAAEQPIVPISERHCEALVFANQLLREGGDAAMFHRYCSIASWY